MKRNLKELIRQMTLEEKAGMCSGLDFWHLKGVERLGIPSVMVSDGPHGLRKQDDQADHLGINESIRAVCFPPAALSACSFDRELMRTFGDAIGKEAQANDLSVVLGPAVNIKRSPLCGRNFEYYSEDPYLAGETASAFIDGVQSHHIGTSIKHFAANNQEYNRMSCSSDVDERTLREIYLPAFETAVKKSQPYTVMCSYNRINGTFASEHPWLLTDVLRKEWGFQGYVMSDWGAVNDRVEGLKAGLELEMPSSGGTNDQEIIAAVKNGSLDEAILDRAVERILNILFQYTDHREDQAFTMEADHALAKHIAEESMVLLKNDSVLPLAPGEKIVLVGEFAAKPRYQGGGSSHINSFRVSSILDALSGGEFSADALSAHASSADALSAHASSADALSAHASSADALSAHTSFADALSAHAPSADALSAHASSADASSVDASTADASPVDTSSPLFTGTDVTYVKGFSASEDFYDETLAAEAIEAAKKADKAVIFAGLPDSFESEGYDRTHMRLPDCQNRLINEILAVQSEVIVVLHNGSPVEMPWLPKVKGLLEAYLGGQAVGEALAAILFGQVNPSGKLAETIPYKLSDNPSLFTFGEGEHVLYNEGIFVGYRYYDKKEMPVAFPFGYGLSYTSFSYGNLTLDKQELADGDTVTVSVEITNTGSREGKEIVQLYVSDLTGAARRPVKELKGFDKVSLLPGETKTVTFTLDYRSFAWYHTGLKDWYAKTGDYEILIGASSRDIRLSKKLHLTTAKKPPLNIDMNTTLGVLFTDERTVKYALDFKKRFDSLFGAPEGAEESSATEEAISEEMNNAMVASMPLRNVVTFGLIEKDEMQKILAEMNDSMQE